VVVAIIRVSAAKTPEGNTKQAIRISRRRERIQASFGISFKHVDVGF
jgi:hypothetical protein